jgi:hypothetical protein
MQHAIRYGREDPIKGAIYTFLSKEPTMTNSRVEALATGSHPPYVKVATSFQNALVRPTFPHRPTTTT